MIREHGPPSSTKRLLLLVLNSFMDDAGEAYPSQRAIAKAAKVTEKTAQRLMAEIIDEGGWLGVEVRSTQGKEWKQYKYRAAIPDELRNESIVTGKMEHVIDAHLSKHGPIVGRGRPFQKKPKVPFLKGDAPPSSAPMLPSGAVDAPLSGGTLVPAQKGRKSSSEFPSEVSNEVINGRSQSSEHLKNVSRKRSLQAAPKQTRAEIVALAAKGIEGGLDDETIWKQYGLTREEVLRERQTNQMERSA